MRREEQLSELKNNPKVDVLIIGGGVNGIGTFRDLALQGVTVLLAEKGDFASGASAGSSHMLHGGIRYLENGEFRLVREALRERNRMLKNAPHYVRPLPTTIPIFKWFSGMLNAPLKFVGMTSSPSERGAAVIKIGLTLYDFYTRGNRAMPTHDFVMKRGSLEKYPKLNPDIVCTATYFDAWMPTPERICIDMIRDAETANDNALAFNYLRASSGSGDSVTLTDELTGQDYRVQPKVVINAAGPWIDFVNQAMNEETKFIGGTKGSHLVLNHPDLFEATGGNEFFFENVDGRIVLIFPFINRVIVGTTDIRIDDPDEAVCTDDEIEYILSLIPKVFPTIDVNRSHIVYTFSGVRPLPSADNNRTGTISRDHSIRSVVAGNHLNFPVHSLIGGKWTTFRAFSEEVADVVLEDIGKTRQSDTKDTPIGGGKDYPMSEEDKQNWLKSVQQQTELSLDTLTTLFERYGTYAADVGQYMSAENDIELQTMPDYTRREIQFIVKNEKVVRLEDFIQRRSLIAMLGLANSDTVREIGHIVGETLGWSDVQTQDSIERTLELLKHKHRVGNI
ncbi:MAG: glycerol-3-phosphate dehydrogenase/oxidase [Anaerolineae bacterium]|nr:glycerol-3-phosphate dehydrogenase/oxidase [Anaerolineae bacterium]MDQ7034148.1 glycerol-3-phosphate dehydrogenase/oxidase [Anaerolineae bacterium]